MTEDQAASALLAKWAKPDDEDQPAAEQAEDEPEAEQADEATADADGEPDSEPAESDDGEEFDFGGEKIRISKEAAPEVRKVQAKFRELELGATRKFQEAAELRKVAETQIQEAQQLRQIGHEQSDLIADHKMIERRLDALSRIDVNALGDSDPVQLTKLNAEYTQLITAKQRIEQTYQQSVAKSQETHKQAQAQKVANLNDFAKRNIKGWSDEYSNKLLSFAVNDLGFSPDALRSGINESLIKAIDLAYQGHKVRTADPKAKIVQNTKTLKPGAAGAKTTAHLSAEKARQKLGKSGRVEDAAMALLARANIRRN